jgi:cysteine dioxygenase
MDVLLKKIDELIRDFKGKETFLDDNKIAEELTELINSFKLDPTDWQDFAHFDKNKYTRNLIGLGRGERFGLMILAWGPGQKSPIHDHNGSHCIMRILKGTLIESLYNKCGVEGQEQEMDSDSSLSPLEEYEHYSKTRETKLETGETAYIHDKIGWHRVSNASNQEPAVSLHLYAPPIEKCKTYCEVEGKVRAQAPCPYYSINGKLK